ncbi:hypothetical protein HN51_019340 [Arachis hypogaea]
MSTSNNYLTPLYIWLNVSLTFLPAHVPNTLIMVITSGTRHPPSSSYFPLHRISVALRHLRHSTWLTHLHLHQTTTPTPNAAATSTASSASLTNSKSISATTASSLPTPPTLALNTFPDDKAWKRGACTSTSSENHSPESASA